MTDETKHRMLPGSHEWPREPECVCGAPYDYWADECTRADRDGDEA